MKKFISILLSLFLLAPSVNAATFVFDFYNSVNQDRIEDLLDLEVTAEIDMEITQEHGITLMLSEVNKVLWQANTLTLNGSAVDSGKIAPEINPEFSQDYKHLYLPILADFSQGDMVVIDGLQVRTYDEDSGNRRIQIDLDGDLFLDLESIGGFKIDSGEVSDQLSPYPVRDLSFKITQDPLEVVLTWVKPPDYDLTGIQIEKTTIRNGETLPLFTNTTGPVEQWADHNVELADEITYVFKARDGKWLSEPVEINVVVDLSEQAPPTEPEEEEKVEITSPSSEEVYESDTLEFNIEATVPPDTAKVMVNDYMLTQYQPGDLAAQYLVREANANVQEGENTYVVVAYDENDVEIGQDTIVVNVALPEEPTPEPEIPGELTTDYLDVSAEDWFFGAVVYGEKIGNYFDSDTWFNPESASNRAEYAKLLNAFLSPLIDYQLPEAPFFEDVPLSHWAALPVHSLAQRNILTGYKTATGDPLNVFGLADQITREQAVAGLVRALELPTDLTGGSPFVDLMPDDWSHDLIVTAYNHALVEGQTPTFFNKNAPLNRAELAQLFYNAAQWREAEAF